MRTIKILVFLIITITNQSCGQDHKENGETKKSVTTEVPGQGLATANVEYDVYLELRSALLAINPDEYGFKTSKESTELFGVIIDLNQNNSIKTISAYQTGDVSVYNSTGMLYMGGVQVKRFREMGTDLVNKAKNLTSIAASTNFNHDLPTSGFAKFYLITNNGIQEYEHEISKLEQQISDWNTLIKNSLEIERAYKMAIEK